MCDRCKVNKASGRLNLIIRDTKTNSYTKMRAIADICVPCFDVLWKDLRAFCHQPERAKRRR